MKHKLAVISLGLLISGSIFGADARDIRLTSIRQKAMGGVAVGIAKNDAALYQNPAGLTRVKNFYVKLPRVEVGVRKETYDARKGIQDLLKDDLSDSERIQKLQDLTPLDLGFSVAVNPLIAITAPWGNNGAAVGIGAYGVAEVLGQLKRPASPYIELTGGADLVPTIGTARYFSFFNRKVALGASFKYIHREQIYDKQTGADKATFSQTEIIRHINDTEEQKINTYSLTGFGVDLGMQVPFETLNTNGRWGLVVRNLGAELKGEKEVLGVDQDSTQTLPVTAALGFEVDRRLPLLGKMTFAADYNVVSPDSDFTKNTHLGIEKNLFFNRLSLRGGVNQGFLVGGVGLDLYLFKLDYAFYAEEMGEKIGNDSRLSHYVQIGILL